MHSPQILFKLCVFGVGLGLTAACLDEAPSTSPKNNAANNGTNNGTTGSNNGSNNGTLADMDTEDAGYDMAPDLVEEIGCTVATAQPWIQEPIKFELTAPADVINGQVTLNEGDSIVSFGALAVSGLEIQIRILEDVSSLPANLTLNLPLADGSTVECNFRLSEYVSETFPSMGQHRVSADPQFDRAKPFVLTRQRTASEENLRVHTREGLGKDWQLNYQLRLVELAEVVDFPRFNAIGVISPSANGLYEKRANDASKISEDSPNLADPVYRRYLSTPTSDTFITQDKMTPLPTSQRCMRNVSAWNCDLLPLGALSEVQLAGERLYIRSGGSTAVWNLANDRLSTTSGVSGSTTALAGMATERRWVSSTYSGDQVEFESEGTTSPPALTSSGAATAMAIDDAGILHVLHGEGVSIFDGSTWRSAPVKGKPLRNGLGLVVLAETVQGELHLHHPNRLQP